MNIKRAAELVREYLPGVPAVHSEAGTGHEHVAYMLDGIIIGYIQHEKAHRWLGYAQGILVADGTVTLEEMKSANWQAGR